MDKDSLNFPEANTSFESRRSLKLLGKGGVLLFAGGVSNASWALSIGLNRYLESTGSNTLLPALGFGVAATGIEYGLTHAATAGDLDVQWNPKRRITNIMKKVMSKSPLLVTSWRGAASGTILDQVSGREITNGRRLAHATLYGSLMGAWVSEPGSTMLENGWDSINEIANRPALAACLGVAAVAGSALALRRTDNSEVTQN